MNFIQFKCSHTHLVSNTLHTNFFSFWSVEHTQAPVKPNNTTTKPSPWSLNHWFLLTSSSFHCRLTEKNDFLSDWHKQTLGFIYFNEYLWCETNIFCCILNSKSLSHTPTHTHTRSARLLVFVLFRQFAFLSLLRYFFVLTHYHHLHHLHHRSDTLYNCRSNLYYHFVNVDCRHRPPPPQPPRTHKTSHDSIDCLLFSLKLAHNNSKLCSWCLFLFSLSLSLLDTPTHPM